MTLFKTFWYQRTTVGSRLIGLLAGLALLTAAPWANAENLALVYSAVATGRTTGHIATLEISNPDDEGRRVSLKPAVIPATETFSGYVIPAATQIEVREGSKVILLLHGYGTDVRRPPVSEGQSLPHPGEWIEPEAPPAVKGLEVSEGGPFRKIGPRPDGAPVLTVPGSSQEFPVTIDINGSPDAAAPFLIAAIHRIGAAYDRLTAGGLIGTSADQPGAGQEIDAEGEDREEVVQQTFWIYTAALEGRPYTRENYFARQPAPSAGANEGTKEGPAAGEGRETPPPASMMPADAETTDPWATFHRVGIEAQLWKEADAKKKPSS